jgi:type IV pilus assembly protein PilP
MSLEIQNLSVLAQIAVFARSLSFRFCALVAASLILVGCGGDTDLRDLEASLESIKRKPSGKIAPAPENITFENYVYSASLLRSPFQPPIEAEPVKVVLQGKQVEPDFNRPREVLEDFSIETLKMVGTIQGSEDSLNALIQDGKGGIQRVQIGNFMGKNHGRITKITRQQIDLVELVPNGMDGWVERPRTVVMQSIE